MQKNTLALIVHVNNIFQRQLVSFQSNKMRFLALELPQFLTFDMDQLGRGGNLNTQ